MSKATLIACRECDLLQWKVSSPDGDRMGCHRCDAALYRSRTANHDRVLALTVAAAVLFVVANLFPVVEVWVKGELMESTLAGAASALYTEGMWPIAGLVVLTTIVMPSLHMLAVIYLLSSMRFPLLFPMRYGALPLRPDIVLRLLQHVAPWGMIEVLMLAMLIALVKLQHVATVIPGVGLCAFGAVAVLLTATTAELDFRELWVRLTRTRISDSGPVAEKLRLRAQKTAARAGVSACTDCGSLCSTFGSIPRPECQRCSNVLHVRKPHSLTRTWAFLIAAIVLYIPAVSLPVMVTQTLFRTQSDTILSGVVFLWTSGSWSLAAIVFIASIVVPMLKIFSLAFLAGSVQLRSTLIPKQRTHIYRLLERIGRWSMLDIYVITILAALVQFGSIATINAGPGAIAFGAVVVLTMLATLSFDPRLIWDAVETKRE